MNRIVETSSDAVDQIQDVYDILHNAANEYADGGYVTVEYIARHNQYGCTVHAVIDR